MRNRVIYKYALPFMTGLRDTFSETVGLAVLDARIPDGVIIGQAQGTQRFSFRLAVNQHFPLHTGAPGKAILAFLPESQRNEIIARMTFTRFNERTISSPKAFRRELDSVRTRGYATDLAEEVDGCHCVSTPILNRQGYPLAAIWVTGPSSRFPAKMFKIIAREVRKASAGISQTLQNETGDGTYFMKDVVERAKLYIREHLDEDFDVEHLARELNVGYTSFRHWFKAVYGAGPAQYRLQQRMDTAKRLLRSSKQTVASICRTLGYEDQNYFSALFKKKTGLSPLAYRRRK